MALQTSAEAPVPVRTVANLVGQWVGRLGVVWVEGQVTQLTRRPGTRTAFLTLRDPHADISLSVTCPTRLLDGLEAPLGEGAQVVVRGRPTFWLRRGTLSLEVDEVRPVGLGALLARLDQLRRVLAAEGVFAADRKRTLPFLPGVVGLVCGRGSAAERDVLDNARRRWPAVRFRVVEVAVQGPYAVAEVTAALQQLDADPDVEVVVLARGGGSVEDLLPFSDEALVRAVAAARTPVVSAIGHEQDTPLLDLVADVRASTPTDAAKRVVPDVGEEHGRIAALRDRGRRCVAGLVEREQRALDAVRSRPALADPLTLVGRRADETAALRERSRRCLSHHLDRGLGDLAHQQARVAALSPAATLERGYAVVQLQDGAVVRAAAAVNVGEPIRVRVASGSLEAQVTTTTTTPSAAETGP